MCARVRFVSSWPWVLVAVESRGRRWWWWRGVGGGGCSRHQDGAIQVAVSVTKSVVWTVLTRSSLDAAEEFVDS